MRLLNAYKDPTFLIKDLVLIMTEILYYCYSFSGFLFNFMYLPQFLFHFTHIVSVYCKCYSNYVP